MKGQKLFLICGLGVIIGCASVEVRAPKEPIKVDISMRLDVYQHVQKDIDAIENIVSGSKEQKKPAASPAANQNSMLYIAVSNAYAQDISPEAEEAALRRKARYADLASYEQNGIIGENSSGLVVLRNPGDAAAQDLTDKENSDRMVIYRELADKNGVSVESIQKVYAERLQKDAPAGTPVEGGDGSWTVR
ncbi:MAG: YdbL family protein [Candidatus Omnitrophica bacterium]|nr:YdbL family protein [Candidatus Omnitrophota bacterium]